jgi:protein-L-isoaspartate O-methyltransferase
MIEHFSSFSFRDPGGRVYVHKGRILRWLRAEAAVDVLEFLRTPVARTLTEGGQMVSSRALEKDEVPKDVGSSGEWLEHSRVWFPSFPYEWIPEMLHDAGQLTLDLARDVMFAGFELKDATPFNVLFEGSRPVFIDVASVQKTDSGVWTWHAYAQFVQSFLLPLLAHRVTGIRMEWIFARSRNGIAPSELTDLPGLWRSRVGRRAVARPRLFERKSASGAASRPSKKAPDPEVTRFVRGRLFRSLDRDLRSVYPPDPVRNDVTAYAAERGKIEADHTTQKQAVVTGWLEKLRAKRVLDVGANTGDYSQMAADGGAKVVSIDKAPEALSLLYRRASSKRADVQPLLVDLMRPTPSIGWRNGEHASFLDRAAGQFDVILFLAVIHHVVINDRVPLEKLFELLATLTTGAAIVEFVAREDDNFVRVSRGRDQLFYA